MVFNGFYTFSISFSYFAIVLYYELYLFQNKYISVTSVTSVISKVENICTNTVITNYIYRHLLTDGRTDGLSDQHSRVLEFHTLYRTKNKSYNISNLVTTDGMFLFIIF